jgi:O-acetyl-ADP-ribose deacetylase (regulator of RNase III)
MEPALAECISLHISQYCQTQEIWPPCAVTSRPSQPVAWGARAAAPPLAAASSSTSAPRCPRLGRPCYLARVQLEDVEGDLLDQPVDAIVNAWNRNVVPWWLLLPQGVSGAIKRRAGLAPFREVARHGPIPLGGAVVTSAGRLPHKAIIHVAGINLLWTASERSIRASLRNALAAAAAHAFTSVAVPAIGAGSGRFDEAASFALMKDEARALTYAGRVVFVHFARR